MTAPIRRRPGSTSPLALVPEVEELRTSPVEEPKQTATPAAPVPPAAAPVEAAAVAELVESDERKAVTFGLRVSLKKRAETAVLRTAGYQGGYTSMAALVEGALERELERLALEFNNGEPFPRNTGGFRQGRPLGS
jgi:hypothetical protein